MIDLVAPSRWLRLTLTDRLGLPYLGLLVALLFFCMSLTPSLVPRSWLTQGVLGGISATIGFALGTLLSHLGRQVWSREPADRAKVGAWAVLGVAGLVLPAVFLGWAVRWQHQVHEVVGEQEPQPWSALGILVVSVSAFVVLLLVGRTLRRITRAVIRPLRRWAPPHVAAITGTALVAMLAVGLVDGVVLRALFGVADRGYQAIDAAIAEGIEPPTDPLRSGGPGSLAPWETLGDQGRSFVTGAPTIDQLDEVGNGPSREPIRVYTGLTTALDPAERAELAVRELERTGAFDREVLGVMGTTGTGWVNPVAADALEHLHAGDTALVAMQYSYLPSWMAFLVERERAEEAGQQLIGRVHERWSALPEDERPTLLVYGESLGSFAGESAFEGLEDLVARVDGAQWVGGPESAPLRRELTARRDPGSPERLPVVDEGRTVRFASSPDDLTRLSGPWEHPRVVFLQQASDPIAWWSPQLLYERPDWLTEARGDDVLDAVRWYPFVTFWQVTADLTRAEDVPPGHGHDYGTKIVDAWVAVAAPDDWTDRDTARLRRLLDEEHLDRPG